MTDELATFSAFRLVASFVAAVAGLTTILLLETTPAERGWSALSVGGVVLGVGLTVSFVQIVIRRRPVFGDDGWWVVGVAALSGVGVYASMTAETPVTTGTLAAVGLAASVAAGVYGCWR